MTGGRSYLVSYGSEQITANIYIYIYIYEVFYSLGEANVGADGVFVAGLPGVVSARVALVARRVLPCPRINKQQRAPMGRRGAQTEYRQHLHLPPSIPIVISRMHARAVYPANGHTCTSYHTLSDIPDVG